MKKLFLLGLCFLLSGCVEGAIIANAIGDAQRESRIRQNECATIKVAKGVLFDVVYESIERRGSEFPDRALTARVKYIKAGSEASKAGLQIGDKLISINGSELNDSNSILDLFTGEEEKILNVVMRRGVNEYKIKMTPL